MQITKKQLEAVQDFFEDEEIDEEWLLHHIDISFDTYTKTVVIKIDNMNEQEFNWIKT